MTAFFFAWYRKQKKNIFLRSESRNKNLGHFFKFFSCSLILLWKNSEKNNLVKMELLKEIFLSPEYRFWVQISEIW